MITIYGLNNCDTCRKALSWLKAKDIDARLHDVRRDGLPVQLVKNLVANLGVETIVNRRSTTWRHLPDKDKQDLTAKRACDLLAAHPALMKRPVLDIDGRFVIGFSKDIRTELERLL